MIKKLIMILIIFILMLMINTVSAVTIEEEKISLDIKEDGSVDWIININYQDNVTKTDYYILTTISDIKVVGGNENELKCEAEEYKIGTSIICDDIQEKKVTYYFTAYDLIKTSKLIKTFSYSFPMTDIVKKFDLTLKLPLGAAIVKEDTLNKTGLKPFKPENGTEGSDGRRIFVQWVFNNPELGKTIETSVIYEQIFGLTQILIIAVAVIVAAFMISVVLLFKKKNKIEQVLPVLNENERKVMQVILSSKDWVDQRKIVKEVDFSKSKVSRIIKDLEQRGLIKTEKRGRANKVMLAGKK